MLQIFCSTKCYIKKWLKRLSNVKTMTSNEDTLRKRVYPFQEKHSDNADSFTVKHFQEGVPRLTECQILRRK